MRPVLSDKEQGMNEFEQFISTAEGYEFPIGIDSQNKVIKDNLTEEELDACFTLDYYFKNLDHIYKRNNLE